MDSEILYVYYKLQSSSEGFIFLLHASALVKTCGNSSVKTVSESISATTLVYVKFGVQSSSLPRVLK